MEGLAYGAWLFLVGLYLHCMVCETISPPLCFTSCVCDKSQYIRCSDNPAFTQRLKDFNKFVVQTRTGVRRRLHLKTDDTSLPKFIQDLPAVYYLSLAENKISVVQKGVLKGMWLRELNLSHNAVEDIQEEAFKNMYHLQTLDLSHNQLTSVSKLVFSKLPNLKVLILDFNPLLFFPFDALTHLPQLEVLTLNNNRLTYLMPGSLGGLSSVRSLGLRNNSLWSFIPNIVEEMPALQVLDVSKNPFHCSCALGGLANVISSSSVTLVGQNETSCFTPLSFHGKKLVDVVFDLHDCEQPMSVLKYDAKDALYTSDVELSCDIQGDPDPAVLWVTPWGDHFAHSSHWARLESVCKACKQKQSYDSPAISLESTVSVLNGGKSLQITNFRGFFSGNITCRAYNYLGNDTAVRRVQVYSGVPASVHSSLFIGAFSAGGFLCIGLLVGSIKLVVLACMARFGKRKNVARTPTTLRPSSMGEHTSLITDSQYQDYCLDFYDFYPSDTPCTTPIPSSPTGLETPTAGRFPANIRDTMEEVRGRLRSGVGRKMKTVKRNVQSIKETGKRNVQSIKESGSVYMHNIMETGSTAASKVKAGVVMGVETVKYHVQSIKEFCGTGDMGAQTISMMSMETDMDTNETREVVKSVTLV